MQVYPEPGKEAGGVPVAMAVPVNEGVPVAAEGMVRETTGAPVVDLNSVSARLEVITGFEVKQVFHAVELLGWEKCNQYEVYECLADQGVQVVSSPNSHVVGPKLIHMKEDSECCERQFCGPARSLQLRLFEREPTGTQMATWIKGLHLGGLCCVLRPSSTLIDANNNLIAEVEDPFRPCEIQQDVTDAQGNLIYNIRGNCCNLPSIFFPCCFDWKFAIYDVNDTLVGYVWKRFNGCEELITRVNRFSVTFPPNIPPGHKLALLSATMLLDFEYFEANKN